jgi:hypothetical protein
MRKSIRIKRKGGRNVNETENERNERRKRRDVNKGRNRMK